MRIAIVTLSLTFLGAGCIDDLPLVQVIEDTRILAARMEVDGEPARAWPRPDETGVVSFRVVDPTDTASVGWGFVVCPAMITPTGLKTCAGDPLDIVIEVPTADVPMVPVSFPAAALTGVDDVLMQGVFCPDGTPTIDLEAMDVTCEGGDEPRQLVNYTIHIERDGLGNMNPTIIPDALTFAGAPWSEPTSTPPETGCAAMAGTAELPLATRSAAPEMGFDAMGDEAPAELIIVTGDQADRETYPAGDETGQEDLVFAHYSTLGSPSRQFTVIDEDETEAELEWTHPAVEDIAEGGTLVRFFFTLTDQRGGTDWTNRHLCVVE
jgi:hypothetical protein